MAMKCMNCKQVELAYKKGIGEGKVQGNREGRKEGSIIAESDLEWFYSRMAVALTKKRHWKPETIMKFIKQMDEVGSESFNILVECYELTGLQFCQHEEGDVVE